MWIFFKLSCINGGSTFYFSSGRQLNAKRNFGVARRLLFTLSWINEWIDGVLRIAKTNGKTHFEKKQNKQREIQQKKSRKSQGNHKSICNTNLYVFALAANRGEKKMNMKSFLYCLLIWFSVNNAATSNLSSSNISAIRFSCFVTYCFAYEQCRRCLDEWSAFFSFVNYCTFFVRDFRPNVLWENFPIRIFVTMLKMFFNFAFECRQNCFEKLNQSVKNWMTTAYGIWVKILLQ